VSAGGGGGGFGGGGNRRFGGGQLPGLQGGRNGGRNGGGFPAGSGARVNRGGGLGGGQADSALVALLEKTGNRWAAATNGSMLAAPLELSSGKAVMAIGGFTGGDPSPTLAEFQKDVAAGEVHYYIGGGGFGRPGGGSGIEQWVTANFAATTVGGATVYDLTAGGGTA
jgi:hypothetical protein